MRCAALTVSEWLALRQLCDRERERERMEILIVSACAHKEKSLFVRMRVYICVCFSADRSAGRKAEATSTVHRLSVHEALLHLAARSVDRW